MDKKARYKKKYKKKQKIAIERIKILYEQAKLEFHKHRERSNRYVYLAQKLGMRAKVSLPTNFKRQICKHCNKFIVVGFNARKRLRPKRLPHIVITCLECNNVMRYPYLDEKRMNQNDRQKRKI